jgi:hypothetical protein
MKTNFYASPEKPTVDIAINKSRLKVYKNSNIPVYYLKSGQEFQIELFNPTTNTILAKIHLNSKTISQGGLILRPGERVFLDRYFDVSKKFKFDTYEVNNSNAVKQAIRDNGDVRVEFFNESKPLPYYNPNITLCGGYFGNSGVSGTLTIGNDCSNTVFYNSTVTTNNIDNASFTCCSASADLLLESPAPTRDLKAKSSKTIETGRVEEGGYSNQKFETVNKDFDYYPFHTVEYKLLPISQRVNTVNDMKVKVYCTNCGAKTKPEHKFCANCGTKQ